MAASAIDNRNVVAVTMAVVVSAGTAITLFKITKARKPSTNDGTGASSAGRGSVSTVGDA